MDKLKPISGWTIDSSKVDYRTWNKYTEKTFYLTTQAWQLANVGDALVGVGPDYDCHVVARIHDEIHEMRGKHACMKDALEEMGYLLVTH